MKVKKVQQWLILGLVVLILLALVSTFYNPSSLVKAEDQCSTAEMQALDLKVGMEESNIPSGTYCSLPMIQINASSPTKRIKFMGAGNVEMVASIEQGKLIGIGEPSVDKGLLTLSPSSYETNKLRVLSTVGETQFHSSKLKLPFNATVRVGEPIQYLNGLASRDSAINTMMVTTPEVPGYAFLIRADKLNVGKSGQYPKGYELAPGGSINLTLLSVVEGMDRMNTSFPTTNLLVSFKEGNL